MKIILGLFLLLTSIQLLGNDFLTYQYRGKEYYIAPFSVNSIDIAVIPGSLPDGQLIAFDNYPRLKNNPENIKELIRGQQVKLTAEFTVEDGRLNGSSLFYFDGMIEGAFKENLKIGKWSFKKNKTELIYHYYNGVKQGAFYKIQEDQDTIVKGLFRLNKAEGRWLKLENGNITESIDVQERSDRNTQKSVFHFLTEDLTVHGVHRFFKGEKTVEHYYHYGVLVAMCENNDCGFNSYLFEDEEESCLIRELKGNDSKVVQRISECIKGGKGIQRITEDLNSNGEVEFYVLEKWENGWKEVDRTKRVGESKDQVVRPRKQLKEITYTANFKNYTVKEIDSDSLDIITVSKGDQVFYNAELFKESYNYTFYDKSASLYNGELVLDKGFYLVQGNKLKGGYSLYHPFSFSHDLSKALSPEVDWFSEAALIKGKWKVNVVNGKLEGKFAFNDWFWKVKMTGEFNNGQMNGPVVVTKKGELLMLLNYYNGKLHGEQKVYDSKNKYLLAEVAFEDGQVLNQQKFYNQDGTFWFECVNQEESAYIFYQDEDYLYQFGLKNVKPQLGPAYKNINDSLYDGTYKKKKITGELLELGNYTEGEKTGVWEYYTDQGVLIRKETYSPSEIRLIYYKKGKEHVRFSKNRSDNYWTFSKNNLNKWLVKGITYDKEEVKGKGIALWLNTSIIEVFDESGDQLLKQGTGMLTYTEKSVTYYSYWQDGVRLKNEEFRLNEMVAEEVFENGLLIRTEYVSGLNQIKQSVFNSNGLIWKKQFRYD